MKYDNDDDDEIFIVHDEEEGEEEDEQEQFFVEGKSDFDSLMNTAELQKIENPFKDTLADGSFENSPEPKNENKQGLVRSELLPVTVQINDNYMSGNMHNENMQKRKNRKKGNVSVHQFDEATKKAIEEAIAEQELSKSH